MGVKLRKKIMKSLCFGLIAVIAAGTTAFATTNDFTLLNGKSEVLSEKSSRADSGYVDSGDEEGYWIRGKKSGNLVSEYKNYKKEGRAFTVNGAGDRHDTGWVAANTWADSNTLDWSFWGTNKAYYDYQ